MDVKNDHVADVLKEWLETAMVARAIRCRVQQRKIRKLILHHVPLHVTILLSLQQCKTPASDFTKEY